MFGVERILAAAAWAAQAAAWRLRRAPRWHATGGRGPMWTAAATASARALSEAGRELGVAVVAAAGRLVVTAAAASLALYGLAVAAIEANIALAPTEVTSAAHWRGQVATRRQRLVVDRHEVPIGIVGATGSVSFAPEAAPIPAVCVDLVLAQEDAHHDQRFRRHRGVDLGGAVAALLGMRGGSTLPMQVARLAGDLRAGHSTLDRKRLELASAAVILDEVYAGDIRALAADYLEMAPMAMAVGGGGEVTGLSVFADAVFHKPPRDLGAGECALAVASLPTPLWLNDLTDRARARHGAVADRAARLLEHTGLASADALKAVAEFRARFPTEGIRTLDVRSRRQFDPLRPVVQTELQGAAR